MKESILWVDHLKWFGIMAVILGHIASPFSQFIFVWHMPLFFMVSGFFIKADRPLGELARKDFHRLMIPYFIFGTLGLVVEMFKHFALHREQIPFLSGLKGILIDMNYDGLQAHYGFVLWFLPTLFLARLTVIAIQKQLPKILPQAIIVLILFGSSFLIKLPFAMDHAMNVVLWVWLGSVLFPVYQKSIPVRYGVVMSVAAIVIGFFWRFPILNLADKFYEYVPLNVLAALLLITVFIFILQKIKTSLTKIWASETLLLMVFHPYTNNAAHLMVEKISSELWVLKFLLSLILLQGMLFIKKQANGKGIFKYV